MKSTKLAIAVSAALLTADQTAFALEEFFTAPGTRAVSMGGAFAAVATDSSAIYYNPAGLGFMAEGSSDVTLEYGDVVIGRELDTVFTGTPPYDLYDTDTRVKYAGFGMKGFGVAYFRPYDFYSQATLQDSGTTFKVHTEYQEAKLGFGGKLNEHLALGATLDIVSQNTDSDCSTCLESENEIGMGGSVGALAKTSFGKEGAGTLKGALVYRSKAEVDVILGDFTALPGRPSQFTVGASVSYPIVLGGWSVDTTLSAQSDTMDYDEVIFLGPNTTPLAVSHDRTSFGGEFHFISPQNLNLFLRLGAYEDEADGPTPPSGFKPYSAGVEGTTLGAGIMVGKWVVDYGVDNRTIKKSDFTDVADADETLMSLSVSYSL